MIRYTLTILMILSCCSVFAQRYKDVFPAIANATSDEEALSLIKSYMIEDLDHPNSNLRLALIYERRYRNSHPLTEYEKAMANAEEASLRFIKAAALVDDKEVKKNPGWYSEFSSTVDSKGRPVVEFQTVNNKIRSGYDSAKLFVNKIPPIYSAFTHSVDYYDKAIKLFAEINGNYTTMDRLLLLYNDDLNDKLSLLEHHYDSSIHYLEKYLSLVKEFPSKDLNQTYTIKPIKTYRLEGLLTSPNFLVKNIEIWNYKAWSKEIKTKVDTDIKALRDQLMNTEAQLNTSLETIGKNQYSEDFKPLELDKKLIFNLRQYDYESLPVALLKFKEFQQGLKMKYNITQEFDSTENVDIQNVYYGELIYHTKDADSLLQQIKLRISDANLEKYTTYITRYYTNKKGLNEFIANNQKQNHEIQQHSVKGLHQNLLQLSLDSNEESYGYRRLKIPAQSISIHPDSLTDDLATTYKAQSADGSIYLAGIVRSGRSPKGVKSYLARVSQDKVEWYREFANLENSIDQVNMIGGLEVTPEGCAIAVHTYTIDSILNKVIYISESGDEIFNNPLKSTTVPRAIKYIEQNSSFVVVSKGNDPIQHIEKKEVSSIESINLQGESTWAKAFEFGGDIQSLTALNDGFMLIGNFSSIKTHTGEQINTKINEGQTNAYLSRFDLNGNGIAIDAIKSSKNYSINRVIKVNDSVINLLGYDQADGTSVHIIVNHTNQLIFSNLD